jgi:nucleoid DNA-binding protein
MMLSENKIIEKIKEKTQINSSEIKRVIRSMFHSCKLAMDEEEEIYLKYLGTFKKKKR